LTGVVRNLERVFSDAHEMIEIMNQPPELIDSLDAQELSINKGSIEFNNVTFRYEDASAEDAVLAGFTLHIKPGEKIGLVGRSGGGKTTITKLALRFMDIQSGTISIDNQNIAHVTQQSLRRAISYVPQEPLLFHRTLEENVRYGNLGATHAEVEKAAQLSHADEFINDLPRAYSTLVGERGIKLSGGQRQRVAIARAMLKDAPILILDEATSALDSESEVLIQDALWKLMADRTAIVIAHRLSTIQKMDRIIVMDKGKIAEEGTHQALLKHKGIYAKLWAHQSGGFLEE
jgi:ATP-binding cassette subfamily B protein